MSRPIFSNDSLRTRARVLYVPGKGYYMGRLWDKEKKQYDALFGYALFSAHLFDPAFRSLIGVEKSFLTRHYYKYQEYLIICPLRADVGE